MNIIIFGSTGMLGSSVLKEFVNFPKVDIFATYQNTNKKKKLLEDTSLNKVTFLKVNVIDVDNFRLKRIISKMDVIINCIGLINKKKRDKDYYKNLININSLFPQKLIKLTNNKQKIFQITTDGVFDGKMGGYKEDDIHSSLDHYSLSKSNGEIVSKNFFNIRCSIIGRELIGNNSLVSWFLNTEYEKINGYSNHLWNGLSTKVFAKILYSIIIKKISLPNKFHLVPKDNISKYNLLKYLKKFFKKNIIIKKYKTKIDINRTLSTNYKKLNLKIWKTSFKKHLTIKEIIRYI